MYVNYPNELFHSLAAAGFNRKEAKIYLAGLELGPSSVLDLARRTRLPRTTLYPVLEDLRRRGVFRLAKIKGRTTYIVEPPTALLKQLHDRETTFESTLTKLEALYGTVKETAGVTMYEGTDGFKQLWQKIFRSGVKEYRILTSGIGLLEYVHEPYLVKRVIAERLQRGIKSLQLISDTAAARKIIAKDSMELRESRLLPATAELPATILIFAEQVAFITTRRENTMIFLASGESAITHRTLFNLLWSCVPVLPISSRQLSTKNQFVT